MKKAPIYALALALVLSLTACSQPKAEQPTDPAPGTSAPADTSAQEPAATPEPIKDTTPEPAENTTPEPQQAPAAPAETEDTQPPEETKPQEAEQVQLFTDCSETVYATGTVNIRASYTAESGKLGSLSAGDSVTRTGAGVAGTEADGWSRVQLSDGTTAYIANQYLSAAKPVQQQPDSKPSGDGSTTGQGESQQTQTPTDEKQQTSEQEASTSNTDGWDQAFYETLTPEQQEVYKNMPDASYRNQMQQSLEKQRKRAAEGWTTEFGDPTEEDLEAAWSKIKVG